MKVNDALYDENSVVALGSNIKLEFTSVGSLTEFYVSECVATNELDSSDANYQALSIIQSGCPVNKDNDPELTIDPQLIDNAQTLSFNQFAFIGDGTYLALSFFTTSSRTSCPVIAASTLTNTARLPGKSKIMQHFLTFYWRIFVL